MADILFLPLKGTYDAALRDQDPMRRHSKGYPAIRDPQAVMPKGLLQDIGAAGEHKMRQHYGPALQS